MERNTIHFLSLSSGARFALASYNSNLGPLDMKLNNVNEFEQDKYRSQLLG